MKEYYFINSNNGPFMGKSDFENIDDELGADVIILKIKFWGNLTKFIQA